MPYYIQCFIPVEPDNPYIMETKKEAQEELIHFQEMQPENIYVIIKCDENGEKI